MSSFSLLRSKKIFAKFKKCNVENAHQILSSINKKIEFAFFVKLFLQTLNFNAVRVQFENIVFQNQQKSNKQIRFHNINDVKK